MRTALGLGFVLLLILPSWSSAEIYRWTDAEGRVHFTQDLTQVPAVHRAKAEEGATAPRPDRLQTYSTSPADRSRHHPPAQPDAPFGGAAADSLRAAG